MAVRQRRQGLAGGRSRRQARLLHASVTPVALLLLAYVAVGGSRDRASSSPSSAGGAGRANGADRTLAPPCFAGNQVRWQRAAPPTEPRTLRRRIRAKLV